MYSRDFSLWEIYRTCSSDWFILELVQVLNQTSHHSTGLHPESVDLWWSRGLAWWSPFSFQATSRYTRYKAQILIITNYVSSQLCLNFNYLCSIFLLQILSIIWALFIINSFLPLGPFLLVLVSLCLAMTRTYMPLTLLAAWCSVVSIHSWL